MTARSATAAPHDGPLIRGAFSHLLLRLQDPPYQRYISAAAADDRTSRRRLQILVDCHPARNLRLVRSAFVASILRMKTDSSRKPDRLPGWLRANARATCPENGRIRAGLDAYPSKQSPGRIHGSHGFATASAQARLFGAPVVTREPGASPLHSRSIGLSTPGAPRCLTWR